MVVSPRARAPRDFGDGNGDRTGHTDPSRRRFLAAVAVTDSDPIPAAALSYHPFAFPRKAIPALTTPILPPLPPHCPSNESSDVWFIWIQLSDSKIGIF